ncbi:4980_t:CDS:2, partial [Scutellospora calospora]
AFLEIEPDDPSLSYTLDVLGKKVLPTQQPFIMEYLDDVKILIIPMSKET